MGSQELEREKRTADPSKAPQPVSPTGTAPGRAVLRLQRSIGNQATTAILQPKMMVGAADDRHEVEADRVARQVMRTLGAPSATTAPTAGATQHDPAAPSLGAEGGHLDGTTARSLSQAKGGGRVLDPEVRRSMEDGFGADFSQVRVHDDARADQLNASIQSTAFTTGTDIFFRGGAYQPSTTSGQQLLAHELTHVVQQGSSGAIHRHFEGQLTSLASSVKSTSASVPALVASEEGSVTSPAPVAPVTDTPAEAIADAESLRAKVDTYDPTKGDLVEFLQARVKDVKSIPGMIEFKDQAGLITALSEDMAARSEAPTTPEACLANARTAIVDGGGGGFASKANKIFVLDTGGPDTSALIHEMIHVMTADTGVPPLAKQKNNVSEGFTNYFAEAVARKLGLAIFPAYVTATVFATAYARRFGDATAWKDYLTDEQPIKDKLATRLVEVTAATAPAWNFHIKKIAALDTPDAKLKYAVQQIGNTWKSAQFYEGDAMGEKLTALLV